MQILAHRGTPHQPENQALAALPPHILQTLHNEGVYSISDWRKLGRRRHQLFGITKAMVRRIDAAARMWAST